MEIPVSRSRRRLRGMCLAALLFGISPAEATTQPDWCGGHRIEWAGGPPRAYSALADESSSGPTVEQPAWLIRERWDALVFNAYDRPPPEGRRTLVLERDAVLTIRVCMQSSETSEVGQLLEPYSDTSWWRFHIQRWTGVSWNGEILIADCSRVPDQGWIHVRAAQGEEVRTGNTAFARTDRDSEGRWLFSELVFQPEPPNPEAWEPLVIEGILAHELGHAMGFFHVPGDAPSWIMQVPGARPWPEDESRHAQLAYQVGPNVLYPGLTPRNPFSGPTPGGAARAVHITELRSRIDAARRSCGPGAGAWTDPAIVPGITPIKAVHITQLRTALAAAYRGCGRTPPRWTDPSLGRGTTVKAVHFTELRDAVLGLQASAAANPAPRRPIQRPAAPQ